MCVLVSCMVLRLCTDDTQTYKHTQTLAQRTNAYCWNITIQWTISRMRIGCFVGRCAIFVLPFLRVSHCVCVCCSAFRSPFWRNTFTAQEGCFWYVNTQHDGKTYTLATFSIKKWMNYVWRIRAMQCSRKGLRAISVCVFFCSFSLLCFSLCPFFFSFSVYFSCSCCKAHWCEFEFATFTKSIYKCWDAIELRAHEKNIYSKYDSTMAFSTNFFYHVENYLWFFSVLKCSSFISIWNYAHHICIVIADQILYVAKTNVHRKKSRLLNDQILMSYKEYSNYSCVQSLRVL